MGHVGRIEQFQRAFDAAKLSSPDQLPELEGDRLEFSWDAVTRDGEDLTVIRLGEREIWSEPELWEGYWRFYEVKELLKQRYGARFKSLTPTRESELYLYGDEWRERPVKVD